MKTQEKNMNSNRNEAMTLNLYRIEATRKRAITIALVENTKHIDINR